MSKQSKEIRDIMDDIKGIMLNESYMFGEKSNSEPAQKPESAPISKPESINKIPQQNQQKEIGHKSSTNIDGSVKKIREIAITLLIDLDPASNPEESKLVKGIWDSCDKFLTNKIKQPEQGEVNNNNNN